jgi:putative FmdB family regulatory protein
MPFFDYKCTNPKCGEEDERLVGMSDPEPQYCEKCKELMEKKFPDKMDFNLGRKYFVR